MQKDKNGGKPVNYIEAEIDEAPGGGVRPPIYVRKVEYNKNVPQRPVNFFISLVSANIPFDCYILGTSTHVSSLIIKDNGIFYLFDTTGCTHQIQKTSKTPKVQVQLQQGPKSQTQQVQQSQQQRDKVIYYTSKLILDKEEMPLLNNGQEGQPEGTLSPNNEQQQGSGDTIQPVSLNPFGLDYQNGSSACGIWTSNVLAVASTYKSIKDFIIKDKEEGYVAMFKSEFIF